MRYVLGIDLGTSSLKAVLLGEDGNIAANATRAYEILSPQPGWAEQNPEHWWQACCTAVHALLETASTTGDRVLAVAVGGQMHSTVLLDDAGELLRPAIIWPDRRSVDEARETEAILSARGLLRRLGGGVSSGFMLASLRWCREHEPDLWTRAATALLPKDYLRYRLTSVAAGDASDGSAIPAIDLATGTWSSETLAALNLPLSLMPPLIDSAEPAGTITEEAATACGLRAGTPVLCGGSDQAMAAIGSGLLHPGSLLVSISTGGQLVAPVNSPVVVLEQGVRTVCHALPGTQSIGNERRTHVPTPPGEAPAGKPERERGFRGGYLAHSATLNAGLSAHWLREILYEDVAEPRDVRLMADAAQAPVGAAGLLFLPYLVGERSPIQDPEASGAFVGFHLKHGRSHMARAALEGIAFAICHALDPLRYAGVEIENVILAGGLAQNTLMREIMASVLETPLLPLASAEQSALGAALLAAVHARIFLSLDEACARTVRYERAVEPVAAHVPVYRASFSQYQALHPALRQAMHALGVAER